LKFNVIIKDLFGMDPGSLNILIESCGIDRTAKRKLDIFKTNMSIP